VDEEVFTHLRKAGLRRVVIGLESFNDRSLKYYGKNLKAEDNYKAMQVLDSLGVECVGSYILFNPESTFDEIEIDLNYFYSRLQIDKGVNLINCILSTSTVLSIDEGTNLFEDSNRKHTSDEYRLKDSRLNKLKKISIYISISLKSNLLKMVELEKYYKLYISETQETEIREQLDILWYQLAKINLDTFRLFFDTLEGQATSEDIDPKLTDEITVNFYTSIRDHYNRIMDMVKTYKFEENVFPRVWFYHYQKANNRYIYEPASMTFHKTNEKLISLLERLNQAPYHSVEEEVLSGTDKSAWDAFDWIKNQLGNGGFIKDPRILQLPNEKIMRRTIKQVLKG
jgi:hypothetical protein